VSGCGSRSASRQPGLVGRAPGHAEVRMKGWILLKIVRSRREIPLHLMLIPSVLLVLVFSYGPMAGIIMAFQDFNPAKSFLGSELVGIKNFLFIAKLPGAFRVLWNTLYISFFKIIGGLIVPIVVSLLLNEVRSLKFKKAVQTVIYMPNFISWIILSGIFVTILSPSEGVVNDVLGWFGVQPIFFLGDRFWFPITMIVTDIWKGFGFGTVIYLAALTGIDPTLYESAVVDGASRWKQTLHITLPGIRPIVVLMAVLSMGSVLNAGFDQIFNMYNPNVFETGDIIDTFVYRLGFDGHQYGPAAAVGLFKSIVSFVFVSLSYYLADKLADYRIF
jgi:putative aldouronate transport system permease protein